MSTPVRSILRSVQGKRDCLDIMTYTNYPYYDWAISRVPHKFHAYRGDLLPSTWAEDVLPKPQNFQYDVVPDFGLGLDIDLILCHNRLDQFDLAMKFSSFWHIPTCVVHQLLPRDMKFHHQWQSISARRGHSNIFLSNKIQEEWGIPGYIVPPGIPSIPRDENKQKEISHIDCQGPEKKLIRQTLGNIHFVKKGDFSASMMLINTTTGLFPIHALVAMAAGCCVLTQRMDELEGIVKHEETGLVYKDIAELQTLISSYRHRRSTCLDIGTRARQLIIEKFPQADFVKKMDNALRQSAEIIYTR